MRPPSSNSRLVDGRAGLSRASAVQDWRLHQKLDRRQRRDRAVRQSEFRHTDCWRERRDRIVDTGLIKFLCQALERSRPVASTMRPRVRAGRSWSAPWPSRDHALVPRKRLAGSVPKSEGWRKISNSHHRRPGVDLGRDDRPRAGDDRTGTWARMWPGAGLGNRSFITGAPVAIRSFRRCWIPSPNPTVSE